MFGDTQEFKTPKDKHYRYVGRGKHRLGGVPYWETRNGVTVIDAAVEIVLALAAVD